MSREGWKSDEHRRTSQQCQTPTTAPARRFPTSGSPHLCSLLFLTASVNNPITVRLIGRSRHPDSTCLDPAIQPRPRDASREGCASASENRSIVALSEERTLFPPSYSSTIVVGGDTTALMACWLSYLCHSRAGRSQAAAQRQRRRREDRPTSRRRLEIRTDGIDKPT